MISGDSGVSVETSSVLGSGCSLERISRDAVWAVWLANLRQFWTLYDRRRLAPFLQCRLWLRLLDLLVLGNALVIAEVVVGLGLHAGQAVCACVLFCSVLAGG